MEQENIEFLPLGSIDDDEKEELWRLLQKIYDNMRRNEV